MQTESPEILAGYLNIHHFEWDPIARGEANDGELLLEWTATRGLFLRNSDQTPIHDAGAVLDLCFTRHSSLKHCQIRQDLESGSDYRTILTQIMDEGPEKEVSDKILQAACNWTVFNNTLKVFLPPPSLDPEEEAPAIINTLTTAL